MVTACERLLPVTFFVTHDTESCRTTRNCAAPPVCDDGGVTDRPHATPDDPVLEKRRRIAGLVALGQRVGYALFGVAVVLFVVGLVAGFGGAVTGGIVAAIVVGSLVLAPAIVFGYAVKAAERDDREQGRPTLR